jgi:sulfate transport system ATP-binding protein
LKIIAGLEHPDAGEVRLNGKLANDTPPQARNLGVVFQEHALFQRMSVEDNIAFGLSIRKVPPATIRSQVDAMLELTGLAYHRAKLPSQLSGGQRQRVALARALAYKPAAVLFDEPYSALDAITRTTVRREVRQLLKRLNLPSFFITHDQEEALELGDRVAILNEGRIEQIATPFEIYNNPKTEFVATFLGGANLLLGRLRHGEVAVGAMRLTLPFDAPSLADEQPLKLVFRPEDVVLNFQPQLIDAPHYLGKALVDEVTYAGATERLSLRLMLRPLRTTYATKPHSNLVDESFSPGYPISVSRSKWDAADIPLEPGDAVVVGLKEFSVLPNYPITG